MSKLKSATSLFKGKGITKELARIAGNDTELDLLSKSEIGSLANRLRAPVDGEVQQYTSEQLGKELRGHYNSVMSSKKPVVDDSWVNSPEYIQHDIESAANSNWANQIENKREMAEASKEIQQTKDWQQRSRIKKMKGEGRRYVPSEYSDSYGLGESAHPEAQAYTNRIDIQTGASTGEPAKVNPPSLDRLTAKKLMSNMSAGERYQYERLNGEYKAHTRALDTKEGRGAAGEYLGLKKEEEYTEEQLRKRMYDHFNNKATEDAKFMDHMWGNKVPQIAAGGGLVTAGLVGALSNTRGQQTNGQLYGQAPMPGM